MVADTGEEIPPLALPQFPWLEKAIAEATLSGQLQFLEEIPSVQPVQKGPPVLPPSGSLLVLPLAVQGQPRGIFLLARKHSSKPYQQDDICLAGELAYRAGVALENVMLLERIREADRRKDEFLGMLAHELRNPLGPIYNATHLLKLFGPPDPRLSDLRDIIDRQAKHMGRLIDDLLDATRLAHGKILLRKERCDLSKIVRQTVEDYRALLEASCLRLELETPSQPVWVEGDPTRLVQAIGNLLHNAHKFTNPGGVIIIRLRAEADDRGAVISVKDTGIGIEPKMLACVFDVFRQADQGLDRSRGGLGLGLALVKGLIQLHGGEVSVVSHGLGKGAEFSIRLPIKDAHDHNGSPAVSLDIPDARKYRILMIEDNRDAAESARQLLLYEGHDVQTVTSPFAGLEAAHCFRPQIIFCDIGLPGMDGYQIVRTIRQDPELASAYVIALTGYGRTEDQQRAFEAGFDLHLIKPIDYTNLCKALAMADAKLTATAEIRMVGRMSA
jgi:signal transduction histidine kinase/ActR/RegA family two-component response regulator